MNLIVLLSIATIWLKKIYSLPKLYLSTYNEHPIANEDYCNDNEINFFHNANDQYLSSKNAKSLLFNNFNENSNFSVFCLNIRLLSNLKNFSKLERLLSFLSLAPSLIAVTETWFKPIIQSQL